MFISYSQNKEDVILDAYFSDVETGFYIDIGANHPVHDSVTKHFYEKGWRGINVEPIGSLFDLIEEDRPLDINLNLGISSDSKTLTLRKYDNDGLSTFSKSMQDEYSKNTDEKTAHYVDIEVQTITLNNLFSEYVPKKKKVQFLKIDVEGFEFDVIAGNDWKKNRPEIICVEANHTKDNNWKSILIENNYELVHDDGLNEYYLAAESKHRSSNFSYVQTLVVGQQVLPYHVNDKISSLVTELKNKETSLDIQAIHLRQLQKEKETVEKIVIEQQRFSSTVKMLFKSFDRLVTARIENLRTPRATSHKVRTQSNRVVEYDGSSRARLVETIAHNDLVTLYSSKRIKKNEKLILYKTVRTSYRGIRTVAKVPLVVAREALKVVGKNK